MKKLKIEIGMVLTEEMLENTELTGDLDELMFVADPFDIIEMKIVNAVDHFEAVSQGVELAFPVIGTDDDGYIVLESCQGQGSGREDTVKCVKARVVGI